MMKKIIFLKILLVLFFLSILEQARAQDKSAGEKADTSLEVEFEDSFALTDDSSKELSDLYEACLVVKIKNKSGVTSNRRKTCYDELLGVYGNHSFMSYRLAIQAVDPALTANAEEKCKQLASNGELRLELVYRLKCMREQFENAKLELDRVTPESLLLSMKKNDQSTLLMRMFQGECFGLESEEMTKSCLIHYLELWKKNLNFAQVKLRQSSGFLSGYAYLNKKRLLENEEVALNQGDDAKANEKFKKEEEFYAIDPLQKYPQLSDQSTYSKRLKYNPKISNLFVETDFCLDNRFKKTSCPPLPIEIQKSSLDHLCSKRSAKVESIVMAAHITSISTCTDMTTDTLTLTQSQEDCLLSSDNELRPFATEIMCLMREPHVLDYYTLLRLEGISQVLNGKFNLLGDEKIVLPESCKELNLDKKMNEFKSAKSSESIFEKAKEKKYRLGLQKAAVELTSYFEKVKSITTYYDPNNPCPDIPVIDKPQTQDDISFNVEAGLKCLLSREGYNDRLRQAQHELEEALSEFPYLVAGRSMEKELDDLSNYPMLNKFKNCPSGDDACLQKVTTEAQKLLAGDFTKAVAAFCPGEDSYADVELTGIEALTGNVLKKFPQFGLVKDGSLRSGSVAHCAREYNREIEERKRYFGPLAVGIGCTVAMVGAAATGIGITASGAIGLLCSGVGVTQSQMLYSQKKDLMEKCQKTYTANTKLCTTPDFLKIYQEYHAAYNDLVLNIGIEAATSLFPLLSLLDEPAKLAKFSMSMKKAMTSNDALVARAFKQEVDDLAKTSGLDISLFRKKIEELANKMELRAIPLPATKPNNLLDAFTLQSIHPDANTVASRWAKMMKDKFGIKVLMGPEVDAGLMARGKDISGSFNRSTMEISLKSGIDSSTAFHEGLHARRQLLVDSLAKTKKKDWPLVFKKFGLPADVEKLPASIQADLMMLEYQNTGFFKKLLSPTKKEIVEAVDNFEIALEEMEASLLSIKILRNGGGLSIDEVTRLTKGFDGVDGYLYKNWKDAVHIVEEMKAINPELALKMQKILDQGMHEVAQDLVKKGIMPPILYGNSDWNKLFKSLGAVDPNELGKTIAKSATISIDSSVAKSGKKEMYSSKIEVLSDDYHIIDVDADTMEIILIEAAEQTATNLKIMAIKDQVSMAQESGLLSPQRMKTMGELGFVLPVKDAVVKTPTVNEFIDLWNLALGKHKIKPEDALKPGVLYKNAKGELKSFDLNQIPPIHEKWTAMGGILQPHEFWKMLADGHFPMGSFNANVNGGINMWMHDASHFFGFLENPEFMKALKKNAVKVSAEMQEGLDLLVNVAAKNGGYKREEILHIINEENGFLNFAQIYSGSDPKILEFLKMNIRSNNVVEEFIMLKPNANLNFLNLPNLPHPTYGNIVNHLKKLPDEELHTTVDAILKNVHQELQAIGGTSADLSQAIYKTNHHLNAPNYSAASMHGSLYDLLGHMQSLKKTTPLDRQLLIDEIAAVETYLINLKNVKAQDMIESIGKQPEVGSPLFEMLCQGHMRKFITQVYCL